MQIGFIGLGKMGSRMAEKLLADAHDVIVWNRSKEPVEELRKVHPSLKSQATIESLVGTLKTPRVIWLMLPAGEATETMITQVATFVEKDDIVIDGGNAHFKDTQRRYDEFKKKQVRFLGVGVSGGIIAAKEGYPLMVGGDKSAYEYIKPLLATLAKSLGGFDYFGEGGAGHYMKMVHNAIEYGIMQSLGEGFGVLKGSSYDFDLLKVAKLYQKGTLVSGFMLDRVVDALKRSPELADIAGVIGKASGETVWTVEEAKRLDVPLEIIEQSLEFRHRSETDEKIQQSFAAKLVSALRREFGGHEIKKK